MNTRRDHSTVIIGVVMVITMLIVLIVADKANTRTTTGTYNNGTIETKDGNVWKVSNYNGINTKGNVKVTIKFDTKGTDSVLDDEIIEIKEK